jgi:hypothetical protein
MLAVVGAWVQLLAVVAVLVAVVQVQLVRLEQLIQAAVAVAITLLLAVREVLA